ncbi:MAG TPA: glucose-6-phosphate dehydrogenase [Acidimicrobiales bacterium]|jgi:glucose-6-phosphate 1-dehydrogenase|nr:glucose-6-phosphate dehydrogenase [Acidimicrobiales bacterium]
MSSDPGAAAAEVPENPLAEGLEERHSPPVAVVIFGASGDLTSRKILPALARLAERRALSSNVAVVGVARTRMDDEQFRELARKVVADHHPAWDRLVAGFRYVAGDYTSPETFDRLWDVLAEVDRDRGTAGNRLFYLATVPALFGAVAEALGREEAGRPPGPGSFSRLVIEKPFGTDLASAQELDRQLHTALSEDQIYRIDHYLGKETVQNVLALRFANAIFEPVWNRQYVDHVQVTVAESLGVGHRGGFYEKAGALRDIVQNHVMQVLGLTLMEPPARVDAQGIRDEKVKALRSIVIPDADTVSGDVVRGQYDPGWVEGEQVLGYRQEEGVDPDSATETFVAMRLSVDNWRWAGVPVYVRTGKRLPRRFTEVALQFHGVPHLPFAHSQARDLRPDALVVRIQPDEGITLRFGAKVPGQSFAVRTVSMDFSYGAAFMEESPDAYERLLLDAMVGDPTLFIRSDEVEQSWRIAEPVLAAFAEGSPPLARYRAGTWGPAEATRLLATDGRAWGSF